MGQNTDSVMCFFSTQIRFFAKTYTLTPHNGAEAHVSSSQLDLNIPSFWVDLPVCWCEQRASQQGVRVGAVFHP